MRVLTLILGIVFATIATFADPLITLASPQKDWTQSLGKEDHVAYIVLDELQTESGVDFFSRGITVDDFKLPPSSFYEKFNWAPFNCWAGSVLKKGVESFCLPYARLGLNHPDAQHTGAKIFSGIGGCAGLYVWSVPNENRFYLWGLCWNASGVLGPFMGDPKVALAGAVKPRKGQRDFPGVTITVVSQRWLYPNPEDARVPYNDHYDCAHGHMSGRATEMVNLSTFITRLRLFNGGASDVYYQTENAWDSKPGICTLFTDHEDDWKFALKIDYQCDIGGQNWRKLAPGARVEFERADHSAPKGSSVFVILLNENPSYWDPGKLLGTYPVMPVRKEWFLLQSGSIRGAKFN